MSMGAMKPTDTFSCAQQGFLESRWGQERLLLRNPSEGLLEIQLVVHVFKNVSLAAAATIAQKSSL